MASKIANMNVSRELLKIGFFKKTPSELVCQHNDLIFYVKLGARGGGVVIGVSHPCFFIKDSNEFDIKNCGSPVVVSYSRLGWSDNIDVSFSVENKSNLLDSIIYFYSKFTDFGDVVRSQEHNYLTQWQQSRIFNYAIYKPLLLEGKYSLPTSRIKKRSEVEANVMSHLTCQLSKMGFAKISSPSNAFARKRQGIPSFDCLGVAFDKYAHYITIYCYYWSDLQKSDMKKYGRFYPLKTLDVIDGNGWPLRIRTDDIQQIDVCELLPDILEELGRRYFP